MIVCSGRSGKHETRAEESCSNMPKFICEILVNFACVHLNAIDLFDAQRTTSHVNSSFYNIHSRIT